MENPVMTQLDLEERERELKQHALVLAEQDFAVDSILQSRTWKMYLVFGMCVQWMFPSGTRRKNVLERIGRFARLLAGGDLAVAVEKIKKNISGEYRRAPIVTGITSRKKRILIIDDQLPVPACGVGRPRALSMITMLSDLGYDITLFPLINRRNYPSVSTDLRKRGIEMVLDARNFIDFMRTRGHSYDLILVSRPHNMKRVAAVIGEYAPQAPCVYDAEALFSLRNIYKARIKKTDMTEELFQKELRREISLMKDARTVIVTSSYEHNIVSEQIRHPNIRIWGHAIEPHPTPQAFGGRRDILFVGGFAGHDSNEDAVLTFLETVFPLIRKKLSCKVVIIGAQPTSALRRLASRSVIFMGHVSDVGRYYSTSKLFVVPNRYAAGISWKLCEAMAAGVPSVVSRLISDQNQLKEDVHALVASQPQEFADKVIALYTNEDIWNGVRENGLAYIRTNCNPSSMRDCLADIITSSL